MADKVGRLVKKGEVEELGYLELQDYPWLDFDEDSILFPDNPRKNVILSSYHAEDELKSKVRQAPHFGRAFAPRSKTLVPQDLTEEHQRSQHEIMLRKRKRQLDEEELLDLELADLADLAGQGEDLDGIWSKRNKKEGEPGEEDSPTEKAGPAAQAAPSSVIPPAAVKVDPVVQAPSAPAPSATPSAPEKASPWDAGSEEALGRAAREAYEQGHAEGLQAARAEDIAAGRLEGRAEGHAEGVAEGIAQGLMEGRAQGLEEGKQRGYEDGFAEGEAKGLAAAETRGERYFSLLNAALSELEALKREVLLAGRDIFVEIANLCSERVLRQKLAASDGTLRNLFSQAMELYVDSHKVTLTMAPTDAARMRKLLSDESAEKPASAGKVVLREDHGLEPGDFRLESDKEIMSVDLKKAVEQLIDGLRAELFPEELGVVGGPGRKVS